MVKCFASVDKLLIMKNSILMFAASNSSLQLQKKGPCLQIKNLFDILNFQG